MDKEIIKILLYGLEQIAKLLKEEVINEWLEFWWEWP